MTKLGWTAAGGLGVGFFALGITMALGANEWKGFSLDNVLGQEACEPDKTGVTDVAGTERRWAWTGDDEVKIMVPGKVHYRGGEGDEVVVRGPADLVSRVRVRGSEIWVCKGTVRGSKLDVTLPGRRFHTVEVAGSSDMTLENVTSPELLLRVAGSGSIRAQGKSDNVKINIAGSGDAYLAELAIKNLKMSIAGSGFAEAGPEESLDLRIAGSGDFKLLSQPKHVSTKIAGSGKITQVAGGATKKSD